jgi:two-component system sensor histidine kinase/response regulator
MNAHRVLVVEDSPTQAEALRQILEEGGFDVQAEGDAEAALRALDGSPFHLVVSDILMPGLSGYDLCRRIKANARLKALPVLLLTALTDPIDVVHALECGANSFLTKPCDPAHLIARVHSLLENQRLRETTKGPDVEVLFDGQRFSVGASREQVLDLLLSTFEDMVQRQKDLVEARDALAAQHEEMQRIEHQKDELSALIVHDLRSPAAGIMMAAQSQLRRGTMSDADRKLWGLVFTSAQVINRMVLNLLDISSSEDGVFAPRPALIDVPALIDAIHQLMIPVADSMGQRLEIETTGTLPQLRADPELLRRILQNLLDNALRHSTSGTPVILRTSGDATSVTFRVCDIGPGIPPAMRERIFDKYTRIPRQAGETGSFGKGLGLAFCRIAVDAHNGRIWVEDNHPTGSIFVVELPAAESDVTLKPPSSVG